jgi:hypothetical protein
MKKLKNLFKSKKRKAAEAAALQAQFELAQKYLKAIEEAQVEKTKPVAKKPVAKKPTVATEKPVAKKPATKKK